MKVVELLEDQKLSYAKIAEILSISKSCVVSYAKKWKEKVPVDEIREKGRPKICGESEKAMIRQIIATDHTISASGIANELQKSGASVSIRTITDQTVRNTLREMGFKNSRPVIVPLLTDNHKTKRLEWCNVHRTRDWSNVLFTDETSIDMGRCKVKFWHHRESRPKIAVSKHCPKMMFWGGISSRGSTPLVPIRGNMTGVKYVELIREHLLPWRQKKRFTHMILQQDNAPAHVCKVAKSVFEEKRLNVLDWPANSPDLNPIENAWCFLKDKIEKRCPKTLAELELFAKEEWSKIPQSYFDSLINSMPNRISQVIERNGEKADY